MNDKGTVDQDGCDKLTAPSEKKACNYLHAGLKKLYETSSSSDDDVLKNNPSFRQTMGCFLLHSYAKHMKSKAICNIDKGIEKAFELGDALSNSGTKCKWDGNSTWENCTVKEGSSQKATDVKTKLKTIITENDTKIKEMATELNKKEGLCRRFQCISEKWLKQNKSNGETLTSTDWDRVRSKITSQIPDLSTALGSATSTGKKEEFEKYCQGIPAGPGGRAADKDACVLIAAGLKNLYSISDGSDATMASLERTMRCILLNAIADKMKEKLPCKEERSVEAGIEKAFQSSDAIRKASKVCETDDKCFKCERFTDYDECRIKENDNSAEVPLKDEIDPKLKDTGLLSNSSLSKSSLTKTICKPCEQTDLCERIDCIRKKWGVNRRQGSNVGWNAVINGSAWLSGSLLNDMKSKSEQGEVDTYCTVDKDGAHWEEGAAGEANRTACKMIAAGLKNISSIQLNYKNVPGANDNNENPFDHQEFRQLASCLLLKEVAKKMIKQSPICDISKGIERAFQSAGTMKTQHCIKEPCFVCNWEDKEKYGHCKKDNGPTEMKTHLETWLQKKSKELKDALSKITDIDGNKGTLCRRLQCLSSKVEALKGQQGQPQYNAENFWKKDDGEVATLWKELADAMKKSNGAGNSDCNQMDDGTPNGQRDATNPEKKACNYLHAGLKKLYEDTASTGSTPSVANDKILDKNPLLRQTVGCLLLNAYAKKMKGEAKCLVESGIKKAFGTYSRGLITNGSCNVTEPCVPCHWQENILESCEINVNGKKENAKDKLTQVQDKITETSTETLTKINEMKNLCDYIKCAAPNWFKSKLPTTANGVGVSSTTPTTTWCDFWGDKGVKTTLTKMFTEIRTNGTRNNIAVCTIFGDGNPQSVERKACNHIAAGLKYIKDINPSATANQNPYDDEKFFKQIVMCAALNLYADKIKAQTATSCPIDETRIKQMFQDSNTNINSSCVTFGSSNKGCFLCSRQNSEFNNCKLSVAETLIKKTSPPTGNCNTDAKDAVKVQDQMNQLLTQESQMQTTLEKINEMNDFCTQLQCAVKQYGKKSLSKTNGQTTSWDEIKSVVENELKELLKDITNEEKWEDVAADCGKVGLSEDNDGEITAKKKACKLFALGLKHISEINNKNNQEHAVPLKKTMMCAALNLYADQLIDRAKEQCPLDKNKMEQAIDHAFSKSSNIMGIGTSSCGVGANGVSSCFECTRQKTFPPCKIGKEEIKDNMDNLLKQHDETNSKPKSTTPNMDKTLDKINSKDTFCTELQCAMKQYHRNKNKNGAEPVSWDALKTDIGKELNELLEYMTNSEKQKTVMEYCKDYQWDTLGHKQSKTNKAACLLFASGLKHIYNQHNGSVKGQVKGPSFGQTMGCLFLKEYTKQLKEMAKVKKQGNSWVHPLCDIDEGINHAFNQSKDIMKSVLSECSSGPNAISCFECKLDKNDYDNCKIGNDEVQEQVKPLLEKKSDSMQETLENTVCPILLTDLLTPFLPLAPVSIGLSAMAYYLWKYFGPLGKGGARFRRSPAEIPGSSVQEQVLDHVQQDSSHEYRLVKERKPRSAPTRTKRSGRVNRRTIIEIHFEVLDECQKGDTQLNQKDFLELLVQEFMGSELMEEEQVPKEDVLMEPVPMELVPIEEVPMERVPNLGSGFMV
ncbi:SICAvar, type I (fragment) [Plasmodium knowlesi strain H]|uniref:SICAvar, type I n=1 Tax=Plasmodium knowlesi (strain H) TaxID=5851 RepID=A0A1A7VL98_PLAKH